MRVGSIVAYVLLALNQYRLMSALSENTRVMEELRKNSIKQEYNYDILQKKYDVLESSVQYVKPNETAFTLLQNQEMLYFILAVCSTVVLIYVGVRCTGSIVKGTEEFYKNVNDNTKNVGDAAAGAINRMSGGLDVDHLKILTVVDCHGTVITLKPVLNTSGINTSCVGLYIRPANSLEDIYIKDIGLWYANHIEMQNSLTPKLDGEEIWKHFSDIDFDV